jgi:transposase
MKRPHASDDVRERALAAIDRGQSVVDVAAFCLNDPSTIRRWVRRRAATGSSRSQPRSGRPRLIPTEQRSALERQVAAHPDATLAEHGARWEETHQVRPSVTTLHRAMQRFGITRKKRP